MATTEPPVLYTCAGSRGLRATWAAEEAGVAIDLQLLPFPPRFKAPDYLEVNPLGTVPMLVDGAAHMTESCAIAHYLATKGADQSLVVAPDEVDYPAYLDFTYHADATITFPQTVYMRFALFEKDKGWGEAGEAYAKWFWKRLVKLEQRLETRDYLPVRGPLYRGRYLLRLRADSCGPGGLGRGRAAIAQGLPRPVDRTRGISPGRGA